MGCLCRFDVTVGEGVAENGSRENGWPGKPQPQTAASATSEPERSEGVTKAQPPRPPVPTKAGGLPRVFVRGWEAGVLDGRTRVRSLRSGSDSPDSPDVAFCTVGASPQATGERRTGRGRTGGRENRNRKRQRQQRQSRNEVRVSPKPNRRARPFPRKPAGCRGCSFGGGKQGYSTFVQGVPHFVPALIRLIPLMSHFARSGHRVRPRASGERVAGERVAGRTTIANGSVSNVRAGTK